MSYHIGMKATYLV